MKRPTLSLCVIAKNEERNVAQLLKSVEGCFDEVHFTDTGSTDRTVEIARELGCQIHEFKWIDDFSAARNFSFSQAKTDYVMWMDLDDVLENRDAFLLWRDTAMGLADMWMAAYHYTSDANGKPVCSFMRERIMRRDKGFQWKYFCHEGLLPDPNQTPPRASYAPTWAIRHMRTPQDISADRMRNLHIFERNRSKFDARMRYYYGKELFEANKPVEAIPELLGAVATPHGIEAHDRILALQYACYAYMQCNQFDAAINQAQSGLMLAPNRAEFHVIMGDCYMRLNRPVDAVPCYAAAKSCSTGVAPGVTAEIFHQQDAYTHYPRIQLAKVLFHLQRWEEALAEATECEAKFPSIEAHGLKKEIETVIKLHNAYKTAKPCDDIVISCPPQAPYTWDADIAKERSMGGSETAAIEMAQWLAHLTGRKVKIFNVRESAKTIAGVEYIPNQHLVPYMAEHKPWLHIAWRHNLKITDAPTVLWCHDLYTPGGENHQNYDKIFCLTPFHARYVQAMQGIPPEKIHVTRNGIRPDRFKDGPWKKDPLRFVFANSPDRGLDRAMRVLDKVREKHPEVTLAVHYGIEHLPRWGHQALHDRLKAMIQERPWVEYFGATQQDELMKSYKKAAYWVSPSDFIETSMISAMELVCAGVYPIFRGIGGVTDTLRPWVEKGMATEVDSDCLTEGELQQYVEATLDAMEREAYKTVLSDPDALGWESVARSWLKEIPKMLRLEPETAPGVAGTG